MATRLAFIAYETPFAPAGGIAAVMGRLPNAVYRASGLHTVVITPYHHKISRTTSLATVEAGQVDVVFKGAVLPVRLKRHDRDLPWYLLAPEEPAFFAGTPHPYLVGSTPAEISRNLIQDSLLFGTAAVRALERIDPEADWVLFMQDWEAATTALALAGRRHSHKLFLTLHNSYDSPATDADLAQHGIRGQLCPGDTVLSRAIPFLEDPILTVSDQFALDLTEDAFQAEIMAGHLQALLKSRLVGVNNGPFVDLAVDPEALEKALAGDYEPLARWKASSRQQALSALRSFHPSPDKPVWGNLARFDPAPSLCWFVMAGRDDPRQKGYDVAAAGVRSFMESAGKACFFFFPVPGDEGLAGLSFLKDLAEEYPENVLVFPFRWEEGFSATLQGASFGLMPSLYEPFGMANEFYLRGTVGIGRATGGIIQQIVPLQGASCFSHAAQIRAARWHSSSAHPTGLLFREPDGIPSYLSDWRGINAAAYRVGDRFPNRVEERWGVAGDGRYPGYPLFRSMSRELGVALADAVRLFSRQTPLYYRLLTEGISFIQRGFAWERAAQEYVRMV